MNKCMVKDESSDTIQGCSSYKDKMCKPMRLKCMHAYCRRCLDNLPKVQQEGHLGWRCQSCDFFTRESDAREDVLLERLILIEQDKQSVKDEVHICQFCLKSKEELKFCTNCMMVICDQCAAVHERTPAMKYHQIIQMEDNKIKKGIIDDVYYCSKHDSHIMELYCETCDAMLCRMCLESHNKHMIQSTNNRLKELNMNMDKFTRNISNKIKIAAMQVEHIEEEMQRMLETYAKWKNESDIKLERLINKLRATKAAMDEEVKVEESRNLEKLKKMKTFIQNQLERWRVIINLADLTRTKTRHQSQLMELESGLYEQARKLSTQGIYVQNFILTTPNMNERSYECTEKEMRQLIRPVNYESTNKVIDQFVDLNQYFKQEFKESLTIEVSDEWCNRVTTIEQTLYIGVNDNALKQYNLEGVCVSKYTTSNVHNTTIVVKQTNNGDIIAVGTEGLYITNKDFNQWSLLQQGMFCDIAIHGDKFTALEFKQYKVVTYVLCLDTSEGKWRLQSSFDIAAEHRVGWQGNGNETLTVDADNYVIIGGGNTLLVYSSGGQYIDSVTLTSLHMITGIDSKGNIILSNFQKGKLYSIKNIRQMNPNNMEQYMIFKGNKLMRHMTIDCHGNLWILHGNNPHIPFNITKYMPQK